MAPTVFLSFDLDHDQDLCDLLVDQAEAGRLGIQVSGRSERRFLREAQHAGMRRAIRKADQVIVICGEHTADSAGVVAEVRIAQEEETPYFLVWGRRERMCTKPANAKSWEGMYGWTFPILREQVALTAKKAEADERAAALTRSKRT